ncbi:MAG: GNAT family N-acetyltransferase [Candidatus Babeliales bacterium]
MKKLLLFSFFIASFATYAMNYSFDSEQRYGPAMRILVVYTEDGQKIGQIVYSKVEGEIADITIVDGMRKKGIGTELFRRAVEDMKEHSEVSWYATSNAVGFYTKLGAQIDKHSPFGGAHMSIDPKKLFE